MKRALLALMLLLALPRLASASEWGNIQPGVTTLQQVQDTYGKPTKETKAKVEGYDTVQWVYERSQAPQGIIRMTVDFGLLAPDGYKPNVVRLLKLEPSPWIFGRKTVVEGWGPPDGIGKGQGIETFFYKEGLFVVFDTEGDQAVSMIFSIPQPDAIPQGGQPAPASAPAAAPPLGSPPSAAPKK
jgi:hypothetical protein